MWYSYIDSCQFAHILYLLQLLVPLSLLPQGKTQVMCMCVCVCVCVCVCTTFFAPKLLLSIEAAERGSRRAAERGSDAAEIDRGSCKGSLVGGAEEVSFDPLLPFAVFADVVSTDCKETLEYRTSNSTSMRGLTDRNNAHQRMVGSGVLAREADALQFHVIAAHARSPAIWERLLCHSTEDLSADEGAVRHSPAEVCSSHF